MGCLVIFLFLQLIITDASSRSSTLPQRMDRFRFIPRILGDRAGVHTGKLHVIHALTGFAINPRAYHLTCPLSACPSHNHGLRRLTYECYCSLPIYRFTVFSWIVKCSICSSGGTISLPTYLELVEYTIIFLWSPGLQHTSQPAILPSTMFPVTYGQLSTGPLEPGCMRYLPAHVESCISPLYEALAQDVFA